MISNIFLIMQNMFDTSSSLKLDFSIFFKLIYDYENIIKRENFRYEKCNELFIRYIDSIFKRLEKFDIQYVLLKIFLNECLHHLKYHLPISIFQVYKEETIDGNNEFLLHIISYIELTLTKTNNYFTKLKCKFNENQQKKLTYLINEINFNCKKILDLNYTFISKVISKYIIDDYIKKKNNNQMNEKEFHYYIVLFNDYYSVISNFTNDLTTTIQCIYEKIRIELAIANIFSNIEYNKFDNKIDYF